MAGIRASPQSPPPVPPVPPLPPLPPLSKMISLYLFPGKITRYTGTRAEPPPRTALLRVTKERRWCSVAAAG